MIDETEPRIPCWLVWSTAQNGAVTMEAIGLTRSYANQARTVLLASNRDFVQVKIEKSECNHLFGPDLDEMWWKFYGEGAQDRVAELMQETLRSQKVVLETNLKVLWEACALLMPNVYWDTEGYEEVKKVMGDIAVLST